MAYTLYQVLDMHSDSETGRSYLREGEERRKRGWLGGGERVSAEEQRV